MRSLVRSMWAIAVLTAPLAMDALAADPPAPPGQAPTSPPVVGTHQIDRYQAISQIQEKVKQNPKSLADWVILGELAHEVALDLPADQAARYNAMSLDAYEKALSLAPDNPGLKAAVQFAKDQSNQQNQLEQSRSQATQAYLDARRRDLAVTNYTPSVRIATPTPMPGTTMPAGTPIATSPAAAVPAPAATAPVSVVNGVPFSPTYSYRPLYSAGTTSPYTFQQYSSSYYPANAYTAGTAPISAQRYLQQSLINTAGQRILNGVRGR